MKVDTTPVRFLVTLLDDLDDARESLDTLHERMRNQLGKIRRKVGVLLRSQVVVSKEQDEILMKRLVDLSQGVLRNALAQIDPGNLGPQRPGNRLHINGSVGHGLTTGEIDGYL